MVQKNFISESGVSPVVGIMLMLVVTLVIAAVVSGFAGGLVSSNSKAPSASVSGTYSISQGMTISHNGGDAIPLVTTKIYVSPTKSFGGDADKYSWEINKSHVFTTGDNAKAWAENGEYNVSKAFIAGDSVRISAEDLKYVQERPDGTVTDYLDSDYGFANTDNIGLSFTLEFQDSSGTTIAESTVTISG
ncbi:hypothetical protein J2128_001993 [Methanomicrobium sp. W14]|uniref:type IV pilin N-terminal domain-containing protein n=1 Tax=Methanomicrobium sp. W14 TaxID=2817839 RepID=UPI002479FC0F|nr:type IV pilin N-terminal domain-containing protein [Methanomicrobium sp. W14]MBP2134027.1 hypothetical protein [Methanomicrobium sp. W14]